MSISTVTGAAQGNRWLVNSHTAEMGDGGTVYQLETSTEYNMFDVNGTKIIQAGTLVMVDEAHNGQIKPIIQHDPTDATAMTDEGITPATVVGFMVNAISSKSKIDGGHSTGIVLGGQIYENQLPYLGDTTNLHVAKWVTWLKANKPLFIFTRYRNNGGGVRTQGPSSDPYNTGGTQPVLG